MKVVLLMFVGIVSMLSAEDKKGLGESFKDAACAVCDVWINLIKFPGRVMEYVEDHGAGEEAKEQLKKSNDLLKQQNETMKTMAAAQSANNDPAIQQSIDKNTVAINAHAQITKEGFDALKTAADLQRVAQIAVIAGTSVYIAKSANEFYHWAFPTEEELLRREKTSQDLAFLKNRKFLYQCLAENPKSVRNEEGIPIKCEDSFKAFVAVVGSIEAEKLKESFKKL